MANCAEPQSVIEEVIPTPKMPPSLQSFPNELKQQIAANLIVPEDGPNSSLTLLYPPRHNQLIDTSSILALRLVSKDLRDNAATAFETVISEICIGPHESSLDRFVKMSEDPYFKQHIRHITFSSRINYSIGIYKKLRLYHDSGSKDSGNRNLVELLESFCNNEYRMLYSNSYTLKVARGLSNLTRCDSIAISQGQLSSENTRLIQSLCAVLDDSSFIEDARAGEIRLWSAVYNAVSDSRIRLKNFNVFCDRTTSAAKVAFNKNRLDTATFGPQFPQLSTLKVQLYACYSWDNSWKRLTDLAKAIPSVQDLTLSFSAGGNCGPYAEKQDAPRFLTHILASELSLPNLKKLSLWLFGSEPRFISGLISNHRATLRTLRLGVTGFKTPEDWSFFLRSLVGKQDLEQLLIISPWARLPPADQQMLSELESLWTSTRSSSSHVGIDDSLQHVANQWADLLRYRQNES